MDNNAVTPEFYGKPAPQCSTTEGTEGARPPLLASRLSPERRDGYVRKPKPS